MLAGSRRTVSVNSSPLPAFHSCQCSSAHVTNFASWSAVCVLWSVACVHPKLNWPLMWNAGHMSSGVTFPAFALNPFSRCVSLVSVAFKAYIVVVIVYYCQPQVPELLSGGHFRLYWVFPIGSPHTLQAWEVPTGCGVLFMSTWHDFWQSLDSVTNDKNLEVLIVHPCE